MILCLYVGASFDPFIESEWSFIIMDAEIAPKIQGVRDFYMTCIQTPKIWKRVLVVDAIFVEMVFSTISK